jgi:superfamily II DNA or RNA helicase
MPLDVTPGSLVRARGRDWIVLQGSTGETLKLRPLSGSEDDQTLIHLPLEAEPVTTAVFPPPSPREVGGQDGAMLLRDALLLSMRRGAGPFRSFGQLAVEPRAYQLVPLLMALKLDPVRLLIADDVGVGKTIEAALIARELLDRGAIERLAVLCPPHLVDQWTTELATRFHIRATAVTAATAGRLERNLPPSESIFTSHPQTVVSLEYIKSEKRRDDFLRACPPFVIVDEAHACAAPAGRHQRYELLRGLAASDRHLVLLTATPHSGAEGAFFRLLGLLDPTFEQLEEAAGNERERLRTRLSRHFVQRQRRDIAEWKDENLFPRREVKELTYRLTGAWDQLFANVLDYCAAIVGAAGGNTQRERLSFFGTLALMRCVSSSPAAAVQALRTRAGLEEAVDEDDIEERLFDGSVDALPEDDVEPPAASDDAVLTALIEQAEALAGQEGDPKLKLLTDHLGQLLGDGYSPVIFCRYIATAHYLERHLKARFPSVLVKAVTGEITADERRELVDELGGAEERHVLVATDCLSEGVNLQRGFDAVVHYDLSWNPTRHEQREGRVDRYGQTRPDHVVRATLIYGANNPVDGAVLQVILRKAEKIREELGVPVPLPDEGHSLTQALMRAVIVKHRQAGRQGVFDFGGAVEAQAIDGRWRDAAERTKHATTRFAQNRLRPADVLPELEKTLAALGSGDDVARFVDGALQRLGSGLEAIKRGGFKAPLATLPAELKERLEAEGVTGTPRIDFSQPAAGTCRFVHRSDPLVAVLAETLLERTLGRDPDDQVPDPGALGRLACWVSAEVTEQTTVAILRLRHQLMVQHGRRTKTLLVEEAAPLAWRGAAHPAVIVDGDPLALLTTAPAGDPPAKVRERVLAQALSLLAERGDDVAACATRRAAVLGEDHDRVREAAKGSGSAQVRPLLPPDVIGLFVLLPRVS